MRFQRDRDRAPTMGGGRRRRLAHSGFRRRRLLVGRRLGGGAWGGAQQGAARLDIGPSLTVDLRLGAAPARIEADYRWRVAGNAEPGNGGVVTLSTGF